jgi:hypothetical protein
VKYPYFLFKYVSASCILALVYQDRTIIRFNGKARQIEKEYEEEKKNEAQNSTRSRINDKIKRRWTIKYTKKKKNEREIWYSIHICNYKIKKKRENSNDVRLAFSERIEGEKK